MFDHICALNLNMLYVKGYSNLVLKLEIIKKTISISMIIAAIPFGVLAICIARALYTQIAVVINTYYTGKLFGLGYVKQVKDFSKYLIYSIIAVIPAFLITLINVHNVVQLIAGCAFACLIYYMLLHNDAYLKELIALIKKSLRK